MQQSVAVEPYRRLPRGIYETPYRHISGASILVAITTTHCLLSWACAQSPEEYERTVAQLQDLLDVLDPPRQPVRC